MEKRNRLDRRGQSPPPDEQEGPSRTARFVAVVALGAACLAVAWVLAVSAGMASALLRLAGPLSVAVTAWTAWLGYRTARVNRETAKIHREIAERESASAPSRGPDPPNEE